MGSPKALLVLGGRTSLDRILDTAGEANLGRAVVVLGSQAEAVKAGCDLARADAVVNAAWATGMTSSVQAGLAALPRDAEGFFVWPVDLPLVPREILTEMTTRFWINRQNARVPIVVPRAGRRGHPVLFDRRYAASIQALDPARPPRDVVDTNSGAVDEVAAGEEVCLDLDTPADYERAKARFK